MSEQAPGLLKNLEELRERYRRRSLEQRLEAVANDLRDIKLQIAIMDEMFGKSPDVNEELVEKVQRARTLVSNEQYDKLDGIIDELEQTAESEHAEIKQSLNRQLVSNHQQVKAMLQLNEKLEVYPEGQLKALEVLFNQWNWKEAVSMDELSGFENQMSECREFGDDMQRVYREAQKTIIEPLADEGIRDVVDRILDSEPVYLGGISEEKRESLAESDLGDYLTISLG